MFSSSIRYGGMKYTVLPRGRNNNPRASARLIEIARE